MYTDAMQRDCAFRHLSTRLWLNLSGKLSVQSSWR